MKNTLSIIQTISYVAKVLSRIVFVCCTLCTGLCIFGIVEMLYGIDKMINIGGAKINSLIGLSKWNDPQELKAVIITGAVMLAGTAVIAAFSARYFRHEINAGTPFTHKGAKEMFRLGVISLTVSAVVAGFTGFAGAVFKLPSNSMPIQYDVEGVVSLGIIFLVVSVILKHGAELTDEGKAVAKKAEPEQEEN